MSLRKFCSQTLPAEHPKFCAPSPNCEHHWFYDFRVNGCRYRDTTQTSNKQLAKKIEAKERSLVLEGKHQIRSLPDITFRQFSVEYLKYAKVHHRDKGARATDIVNNVLARSFGGLILHEITSFRIEHFKSERLGMKWRGHKNKNLKPIRPATVNRELNTLRAMFSKALEWGKIREHPMAKVESLKVDNRRTRILTEDEQAALLAVCRPKFARIVLLALITGARIGELLALTWENVTEKELVFLETKNGKTRRLPMSPSIWALLDPVRQKSAEPVFKNPHTKGPYTVRGVAHVFRRAVLRAGITTGDVSLHTLRHTALSRMIAAGESDHTVMGISGHSSTKMLERYTHPTDALKIRALETFALPTADGQKQGRIEKRTA